MQKNTPNRITTWKTALHAAHTNACIEGERDKSVISFCADESEYHISKSYISANNQPNYLEVLTCSNDAQPDDFFRDVTVSIVVNRRSHHDANQLAEVYKEFIPTIEHIADGLDRMRRDVDTTPQDYIRLVKALLINLTPGALESHKVIGADWHIQRAFETNYDEPDTVAIGFSQGNQGDCYKKLEAFFVITMLQKHFNRYFVPGTIEKALELVAEER